VISFSRPVISRLITILESQTLPNLTTHEQAHLIVLIQTTLEVGPLNCILWCSLLVFEQIDEQQRALDANGLRYLISMRSFYIINDRALNPGKTAGNPSNGIAINVAPSDRSGRRERLRFRDMIWAFYSESQELLLNASIAACGGKLTWPDARALGIPLWLTSIESLVREVKRRLFSLIIGISVRNLRQLRAMNTWRVTFVTRLGVPSSISPLASTNWSMGCGDKRHGIKSKMPC